MNFLHAVILGIVEGLTEFLPVSSTAHLLLAEKFLNLTNSEFLKTFTISIQLGAILSVAILYWRKLISNWLIWKKIGAAFLPTAVIGFILYKLVKNFLLENMAVIIWALIIGGLLIIAFEIWQGKKQQLLGTADIAKISYGQAVIIGLAQALAIIPGVSRSAATIIGGLALGINRQTIVEFSFLLAIPTMLAATGYDLFKSNLTFSGQEITVWLVGFLTSFLVALLAVKFFISFIQKHSFLTFGIYRLLLGLLAWWLLV